MILNQLSANSNAPTVNSSPQQQTNQQQQQQSSHINTTSISLTPQYSGNNATTTIHVPNQNQQNTQNYLFQTAVASAQPQQTQLYHYQLLKTPPPPQLTSMTNAQTALAFQTQFGNIMPTDQTNYLSQTISFTTKQADMNNNLCQLTTNFTNEHQIYEYMHQLLEEKEKLKELYNEPYSFLLPISAKLLDEGKIFYFYCKNLYDDYMLQE